MLRGFSRWPMLTLRQERAGTAYLRLLRLCDAQTGKEHNAIAATEKDMWSSGAGSPVCRMSCAQD